MNALHLNQKAVIVVNDRSFPKQISDLHWATILVILLVGTRVFVLITTPTTAFWIAWSTIVAVIAFLSPLSGIALTVGNIFVSLGDESPIGLSIGQIAGASATLRFLLQFATHRLTLQRFWRPSLGALAGIMVVMVISAFLSPTPYIPTAPLIKLLLISLLYVLVLAYVDSIDKLLFLQFTMSLCAILAGMWAIRETVYPLSLDPRLQGRAIGLVGNSNYQAIYCAIAMPLLIGLGKSLDSVLWRLFVLVGGISIVGGILATASRGGLSVLGISFLWTLLIWGRHNLKSQWLIVVLLITLVVGLSLSDNALLRVNNLLGTINDGTALETQSRLQLADDSIELWQRNPILGVGAGNWLREVLQLETRTSSALSPHVWPAQVLAELGALGFACYLGFVFSSVADYRRVIHVMDSEAKSLNVIRGFFAASLTMSLAWTSGNPYNQLWFIILFIGSVTYIYSDRNTC